MSFPEFEWTQSYVGAAPDVGAYENGRLVEGPPFRFRIPPGVALPYTEKPRIVRHSVLGNLLTLYFSDRLDASSISATTVELFEKSERITVSTAKVLNDYAVEISSEKPLATDAISLSFSKMPKGKNGENATYWGSTISIHRQD